MVVYLLLDSPYQVGTWSLSPRLPDHNADKTSFKSLATILIAGENTKFLFKTHEVDMRKAQMWQQDTEEVCKPQGP